MPQNTPIWEVMLQSAQVINQTVANQRRAEQQEAMLALKARQQEDLVRIQEQKLEAQQRVLDMREERDAMKREVDQMKIKDMESKIQMREVDLDIRARNATTAERQAATAEYRAKIAKQKLELGSSGGTIFNQASKILSDIEKDAMRYAKGDDEAFYEKHKALFIRSGSQLASLADQLSDRNRSLDDLTRKMLADAYPQFSDSDQRQAMLVAIDKIITARDQFRASAIQNVADTVPPELRRVLEMRTFSGDFNASLRPSSGGAPATVRQPSPGAQAPPSTVDRTALDDIMRATVALKTQAADTPEAKAARVANAVSLLDKARQLRGADPTILPRILREFLSVTPEVTDSEVESKARKDDLWSEAFKKYKEQIEQRTATMPLRGRAAASASK